MGHPLWASAALFLALNVLGVTSQIPPSCNIQITPKCIQALYGLPSARVSQQGRGIGVFGTLNEFANHADLAMFLKELRPDLTPAPSFTEVLIDGGRNDQNLPGVEANLDIQYTVGLANGVPVTFYSVGRNDTTAMFDFANYVLKQPTPPSVVVLPYFYDESSVSPGLANALCKAFMQLGARGISVIAATGDGGVAGSSPSNNCAQFKPSFPASCPYVTAVGGTVGISEIGAGQSAGGFSDAFARPSYQNIAVNSYLNQIGGQNNGRFNRDGRAYPDVSAQSQHIIIAYKGRIVMVDGTGGAAVIFASTIALLNDQLIAAKKPTLGFLNPLLYTKGVAALNDITAGNNPGCGTSGFQAAKGWDPVTGLGTPNFQKMRLAIGL